MVPPVVTILVESTSGGECGHNASASHGELHVAKTKYGMAASVNAIFRDRSHRAGCRRGHVSTDEDNADHVARHNIRVIRLRRACAAVYGHQAVAGKFAAQIARARTG